MLPIDFETHTFDLDYANKFDIPIWGLKYNYRDHFNLNDLSPQSFFNLSNFIYQDEEVAKLYRNSRFMEGPGVNVT